jgi:hypothetical protein
LHIIEVFQLFDEPNQLHRRVWFGRHQRLRTHGQLRGFNIVARQTKRLPRPVQLGRVGIDDQNAVLSFDIVGSGVDGD